MKIPAPRDIIEGTAVSYGASGVVVIDEGEFKCWSDSQNAVIKKYGCIVRYDDAAYNCQHSDDGAWFRVREGLMKITPDENIENLKEEKVKNLNKKHNDIFSKI